MSIEDKIAVLRRREARLGRSPLLGAEFAEHITTELEATRDEIKKLQTERRGKIREHAVQLSDEDLESEIDILKHVQAERAANRQLWASLRKWKAPKGEIDE